MGRRAFGANAVMALAFADASQYGQVPPAGGYTKMAFNAANLGEESPLVDPGVLGFGREPQAPEEGPVDNDGDVTVPVDVELIGYWLKLLFGQPMTTQGVAATGLVTFNAQPAAGATLTVAGQAFTFKAAAPGANEILIGATIAETVRNVVWALNSSAVPAVTAASYSTDRDASAVTIVHDTIGVVGNALTLAASGTANATLSGATLAGGSALGPYNHVYTTGALTLPDAAIEVGNPEVPSYGMNFGAMANTLAIAMQRGGNLRAVIGLVCQGEIQAAASLVGALLERELELFSQGSGEITDNGVPVAELVSSSFNYSNNLEKAEGIRRDRRIDGADGGAPTLTPQFVARFKDRALQDKAVAKQALDMTWSWTRGPGKSLTFRLPAVRLPRTKRPITGPGAVQQTFNCQGYAPKGKHAMTITLVNGVEEY